MPTPHGPYPSPQIGRAVGKFRRLPLSRNDYHVYNHLDTENGDLTAFHYPDEAVLHIQSVIVDGKYQRTGIGS